MVSSYGRRSGAAEALSPACLVKKLCHSLYLLTAAHFSRRTNSRFLVNWFSLFQVECVLDAFFKHPGLTPWPDRALWNPARSSCLVAMNLSLIDPFVLAQEYPDTLTETLRM